MRFNLHTRFPQRSVIVLIVAFGAGMLNGVPAYAASITYETARPIQFAEGVESPVPNSKVNAVSCTSSGNCVAVGFFRNASGRQAAFTATSTNGVWGVAQPLEFPDDLQNATVPFSELSDIDCPSAGNCTAVGAVRPKATDELVVDRRAFSVTLAKGEWGTPTAVTLDASLDGSVSTFYAVSCASAGNCAAVGSLYDRKHHALIQTSSNGSWGDGQKVQFDDGVYLPDSFGFTRLLAVDCAEPGFCSAAGSVGTPRGAREAFTVTSSNGNWAKGVTATFPAGTSNNFEDQFNAISCASAGNCTAAGYFETVGGQGGTRAFTQSSINGQWADAVPAGFADGVEASTPQAEFAAVSCTSPGNCTAVGGFRRSVDYGQQGVEFPFSQTSVAGKWGTALPAKFTGNFSFVRSARFADVSCSSAGNCTAAGYYGGFVVGEEGKSLGFTQTMTNSSWGNSVILLVPDGVGANRSAGLSAIACTSPGNCMSGGYYIGINLDDLSRAAQVDPAAEIPTAGFTQRMTSRPSVLPPSGTNPTPSIAVALVLLAMGAVLLRQRRPTA